MKQALLLMTLKTCLCEGRKWYIARISARSVYFFSKPVHTFCFENVLFILLILNVRIILQFFKVRKSTYHFGFTLSLC